MWFMLTSLPALFMLGLFYRNGAILHYYFPNSLWPFKKWHLFNSCKKVSGEMRHKGLVFSSKKIGPKKSDSSFFCFLLGNPFFSSKKLSFHFHFLLIAPQNSITEKNWSKKMGLLFLLVWSWPKDKPQSPFFQSFQWKKTRAINSYFTDFVVFLLVAECTKKCTTHELHEFKWKWNCTIASHI